MVGLMQYFIFHSRLDIERYQAIIYMLPVVNYFPDLSHINYIQGVKTHTVGNHATAPALKQVHVDY